jgi:CHAT domain-containing protein
MARFVWCLCLILTLLIAGSRRPVVARTLDSDPWWGTEEAVEIQHAAEHFRAVRNFSAAEAVDRRGYELARARRDDAGASKFLIAIGVARLYQFQYGAALEAYLQARDLAERAGDGVTQGIIAVNLSSLYLQTWDIESALVAAEEGIQRSEALSRASFRLPLLLQLGRLHQVRGDGRAAEFYTNAVEEARAQTRGLAADIAQEARAWDLLGEERLREGSAARAELDFTEAFRLRLKGFPADLPFSYARLGAAKLALGEWDTAERFTNRALAAEANSQGGLPRHLLVHQRGEILRARGNPQAALQDFTDAIDLAGLWRAKVPAARSSLVAANEELEKRVFRSFIEMAAEEAMRTGDPRLAMESFQAAELNRAASLRQSMAFARDWRDKLPKEYWRTLAELRAEEFQNAPVARTSPLKLALTEMEVKAGPHDSSNESENFRGRTSLIHFQRGLSKSELFLSFYVGDAGSYLWAVTRNSLSIHRLPGAEEIRSAVQKFSDQIRRGATSGGVTGSGSRTAGVDKGTGERLFAAWFSGLSREEAGKSEWLLSLDGGLFQMPFAALNTGVRSDKMKYLVEQHSLQIVPGALSLIEDLTGAGRAARGLTEGQTGFPTGAFLGVGDPIYNRADPRWTALFRKPADSAKGFTGWLAFAATASDGAPQWNRLVGSAEEVENGARAWTENFPGRAPASGNVSILTGQAAQRDRFLELVAQRPAIIHLATHILTPQTQIPTQTRVRTADADHDPGHDSTQRDAQIVFGLGASGRLDAISASEVGMLNVPGAVISMTGCDSGSGDVRAGAGLLGLTRAWQMAGARAVVSTRWPVNDTRGEVFAAFYRNLRDVPAAEAMRRSQVEMIHSGTWRSDPSYWASYQVTGGAH